MTHTASMFRTLAFAILVGQALSAHAQSRHFLIEETRIDPTQKKTFEEGQHDYCAAVVRGGAPSCLVLAPTTFAPHDFYLTLLPFGSFVHYDEGTYTSKGLSPSQAEELAARRNQTMRSNEESGVEEMYDAGTDPEPSAAIVQLTELHVLPGRETRLLAFLQHPDRASPHGMAIYHTVAGGDLTRVFVLRYFKNFAELDNAVPLSKIRGAVKDSRDNWGRIVQSEKVLIMHYRSDLSSTAR